MNEQWHIERFARGDAHSAEESFGLLSNRLRPFLDRYLKAFVPLAADREDVIQTTLTKIWRKRDQFKPSNLGAWFQYAARTARNTAIDYQRATPSEWASEEENDTVASAEFLQTIANLTSNRRALYQTADEALLKVDSTLSSSQRAKQVLAIQLFLLDGATPNEIAAVVGCPVKQIAAAIHSWSSDLPTLRTLAFNHLYVDNDHLVQHVLGADCKQVETWVRSGSGAPGWSTIETRIILYRLRNGLPDDKLAQMMPEVDHGSITEALCRARARFPFKDLAKELRLALRRHPDLLTEKNVWKRLAFQYHASDELPQKQILERIAPAAEVFGVVLTEATLGAWLSIGRLFTQIRNQAQRIHDDEED